MSRILLMGVGPLPSDPGDRLFATGLRVQQFATVLAAAGHGVTLVASTFGETGSETRTPPVADPSDLRGTGGTLAGLGESVEIRRIAYHPEAALETVSTMIFTGGYDCIVSTTDIMNDLSARLDTYLPRWMDFFGDPFAEKQMQAATHDHDGSLRVQWPLYLNALTAGDRFSVCSQSQAMALVGQLGFAGRLNGGTDGEHLVHVLEASSRAMLNLEKRLGPQSRPLSLAVPADAFKVLWSGGYNTWADVETLFHGLESAMVANPRLHFMSTGGAIGGHDSTTAGRFAGLVATSPHRERYHFLGWVPTRDIPYLYRLADVAVNIDRLCYEGELGTRNRLIDWTLFEIPIITTVTCDLANELANRTLVHAVESGSADSLAAMLAAVCANPEASRERAQSARRWFEESHGENATYAPLLNWAAKPLRSGDLALCAKAAPLAHSGQRATTRVLPLNQRAAGLVTQRHHEYLTNTTRPRAGLLKRMVRRVLGGR